MTDWNARDYVRGDAPDMVRLARTMVSSLILTVAAGMTMAQTEFLAAVGTLIRAPMEYLARLTTAFLAVFESSVGESWSEVGTIFPLAGPIDFVIAFVLVAAFFWLIERTWRAVRRYV